MSESEEEGFHNPKLQTITIKPGPSMYLGCLMPSKPSSLIHRSAVSIHHQLPLYEYPKQLDDFDNHNQQFLLIANDMQSGKDEWQMMIRKQKDNNTNMLLSEYFPRRMVCKYNKFHQNLLLKRDMTLLIRNVNTFIKHQMLGIFRQPPPTIHKFQPPISFTSDFQCGNLHSVFLDKKSNVHYLLLQNDINTHGYNQWFYFSVKVSTAHRYRLIIINMSKQFKFNKEMRLLSYSMEKRQYARDVGFEYYQNRFVKNQGARHYFSVDFEYSFTEGEQVYFSLNAPYSYTKMMRMLKEIDHRLFDIVAHVENIGKSEIGNCLPCVRFGHREKRSKRVILITARQHPCETVGSFICQQIIRLLYSQSPLCLLLLSYFTIYIIPMINPDGVIHGNSRTNLNGYDVNRCWDDTQMPKSLQCAQVRKYIERINQRECIQYSIDLHGHSREYGYFAYFSEQSQKAKLMTYLFTQKSQYFIKQKCIYYVGLNKRQSLRAQMYSTIRTGTSITIQTSLYGYRDQLHNFHHYQSQHFKQIAKNILECLLETQQICEDKVRKVQLLNQIQNKAMLQEKGNQHNDKSQVYSDSNPEQDYLLLAERNVQQFSMCKVNQRKRMLTQPDRPHLRQGISSKQSSSIRKGSKITSQNNCQKLSSSKDLIKIPNVANYKKQEKNQLFNMISFAGRKRNETAMKTKQYRYRRQVYSSMNNQTLNNTNLNNTSIQVCYSYDKPTFLQKDPDLLRSIQMRKKIKHAYNNSVTYAKATHRTFLGNFKFNPQQQYSQVKSILYPTSNNIILNINIADGGNDLMRNIMKMNLKDKKDKVKNQREKQYGASFVKSFNKTCLLRKKHVNVEEPII